MWYYWRSDVHFQGEWKPSPSIVVVKKGTREKAMEQMRKISYGWNEEYQRLSQFFDCSEGFVSEKEARDAAQKEQELMNARPRISA